MSEHEQLLKIIAMKEQVPLALDLNKTALLVIDMQRDFVRPEYPFGQVFEKLMPGVTRGYFKRVLSTVVPNVQRLQECFRRRRLPIVYTGTGTCFQGEDLAGWLKGLDQLGIQVLGQRVWPGVSDPAWQIDESIAPLPDELVINKTAADPLKCTTLYQTLRNMEITSVIVCGLTTDVCVTATARECADRSFHTVIAEDACTTLSEDLHRASLSIFSLAFGRVKTTEELVGLLA